MDEHATGKTIPWWRHDMETPLALPLSFDRWIPLTKRGALVFILLLTLSPWRACDTILMQKTISIFIAIHATLYHQEDIAQYTFMWWNLILAYNPESFILINYLYLAVTSTACFGI